MTAEQQAPRTEAETLFRAYWQIRWEEGDAVPQWEQLTDQKKRWWERVAEAARPLPEPQSLLQEAAAHLLAEYVESGGALPDRPEPSLKEWAADAVVELQRLTDIIEGRHKARLQTPHGQTSNRPRQLLERYERLGALPDRPEPQPDAGFDNSTEACRHCPTPEVHPRRIGGVLSYETDEPSLNVERLADAMHDSWIEPFDSRDKRWVSVTEAAERMLSRLSQPPTEWVPPSQEPGRYESESPYNRSQPHNPATTHEVTNG